jgi:uncharacterized membrane protein YpjA
MYRFLVSKPLLWVLLLVNLGGTIYGYIWYESQLVQTPIYFLPFVPDSPTASLFFVVVLIGLLLGKNWPWIEALALITLFKYGVWAVVMNLLVFQTLGYTTPEGWLLIVSHGAMALQGLLYSPTFKITPLAFIGASIWTLHNDVIDYLFGMMPIYYTLNRYMMEIGYFTFWLSLLSIFLCYWFALRKNRFHIQIPQ